MVRRTDLRSILPILALVLERVLVAPRFRRQLVGVRAWRVPLILISHQGKHAVGQVLPLCLLQKAPRVSRLEPVHVMFGLLRETQRISKEVLLI